MAKSRKSTDNPFRAGFDARMANVSIVSCPFPHGSDDRAEWIAGFQKACGHFDGPMQVTSEGPITIVEESFLPDPKEEGGIAWPKKTYSK